MVLRMPLEPADPPKIVELRPVQDVHGCNDFAAVVAAGYSVRAEPAAETTDLNGAAVINGDPQPPEAATALFGEPRSLLSPWTYAVVAYLEGEPVSCAVLYERDGVGGLYWVSTVQGARRRGLGELVTRATVNEGFRRQARLVVLQASTMGAPMYRRLGFVEVTRHRRYVGGGSAAGATSR